MIGDFSYIHLIDEKSKKIQIINFKEFMIVYSQGNINKIHLLENTDSNYATNKLSYVEIDKKFIIPNTNYLREGHFNIIPSIILNPRDENRNLILNIKNKTIYPNNFLKNIIKIKHSKNAKSI